MNSNQSFCAADGVPSSQNPKVAIDSWINHNKVEREEFSCVLRENLKVKTISFNGRSSPSDLGKQCLRVS